MGISAIQVWDPPLTDGSNIYAGPHQALQLTHVGDFPYTFGRDKNGSANQCIILFDFDDKVQPGDYIQVALIVFRASAVDTDALTVDLCLLPVDQQHGLNTDLQLLNSGECAWWQTALGLNDYEADDIASVVSGSIERPSVRMRMRDIGANDLFAWNYSPAPTGIGAQRFDLNEFLGVNLNAMGEEFIVTSGGTLGDVSAIMRRLGSVLQGDVWVEIYSGVQPYTLVATSDLVDTNTLSTVANGAQVDFAFSGDDQITIVSGSVLKSVIRTDLVAQAGKSVQVIAGLTTSIGFGNTASDGAVAIASKGMLSGPRYVVPGDLPLLYGFDGISSYNTPFGLTLTVDAPAFSVSGDFYTMDVTSLIQEWVSSSEMSRTRGDIFGMQVATSLAVNTTDDRIREFEAVSIFINSRPRGVRVNRVPMGN